MSDFIENQVQLLLAGQALESYDICNPHVPIGNTTGMSDTSADCRNDDSRESAESPSYKKRKKDERSRPTDIMIYCRSKIRSVNSIRSHLSENSDVYSRRCCYK
jgi:hypothetical protein